MRRTPATSLLILLTLLAVVALQATGVARGYFCRCSGETTWTQTDHCDGPHSNACHPSGKIQTGGPAHNDQGSSEREDHDQVRDELQGQLAHQSLSAPALIPVLLDLLPDLAGSWQPVSAPAETARNMGPPPGVVIARTVVLLI